MDHPGFQQAIEALNDFIAKPESNVGPPESHIQLTSRQLKFLDLEEALSNLSIIHVAGTKGKGSTCAFVERMLRVSGFKTGFFSSPHLLDIRERFRLDGEIVSREMFSDYFWWCWTRLQASPDCNIDHGVPIARLSRLLTVLALKIFVSEKVDVAILEVGLGGLYDSTNVVKAPVICGITSLGYDHMEVLGKTLGEIATQKAGIFKANVPAITVEQPAEAMQALETRAKELNISLEVAASLESYGAGDLELGLNGEHQRINAALAVALCKGWAERSGHKHLAIQKGRLPESYITGLMKTRWEGRAQIIHDCFGRLSFYIDGAHSPESMEVCAKWFAAACKAKPFTIPTLKVLLFNCMPKRDPQLLLPNLRKVCAREASPIQLALFVPPYSSSTTVDHSIIDRPDLSWQKNLQECWEALEDDSIEPTVALKLLNGDFASAVRSSSAVFPSLPASIAWLRLLSEEHPSLQLQVLVTGSLFLVADVLRLLG